MADAPLNNTHSTRNINEQKERKFIINTCIGEGIGACAEGVFWDGVVLLTSPEENHLDSTFSLAKPSCGMDLGVVLLEKLARRISKG